MANIIIRNVTYNNVPEIDVPAVPSGTAKFYDTASADAAAGDILSGKKAYNAAGEISGTMANNGATGGTISTKAGTVTIPAGFTSGGTVQLAAAAIADLVSANLLSGKTVLGVSGSLVTPTITQGADGVLSIS